PEEIVAIVWMKRAGVDPRPEEPQLFRREALGDELLPAGPRRDEHDVHLLVEPAQVLPRRAFHALVVGVMADVLRQGRMEDADEPHAEDLPGREAREPGQARRADDELRESLAIAVLDDVEERRERQRDLLVPGHRERSDRREVSDTAGRFRRALA